MSFLLSKLRKKHKKDDDMWSKMDNVTKRKYFTAEFECFGDMTHDSSLSQGEFTRLLMLLSFPDGRDGALKLWKHYMKSDGARMSREEYVKMMLDRKVDAKTNMWRKLFAEIDTDSTANASKQEVLLGLEKMGIEVTPEMRKKIGGMDEDKDDVIGYADFLKVQLKQ